jgi:hypothetical protein
MSFNDPSGFERLRHTRGAGRVVAVVGLLVMLAGLAVFGFALLSVFGSSQRVPRMPSTVPIGFGIGIVGALLYSVGLAFGVPRDARMGPDINIRQGHDIWAGGNVTIDGSMSITIDQRVQIVNDLDSAIPWERLSGAKRQRAEEAVDAVREAVENDAPASVIARRLDHLTRILSAVGALTGAGGAVAAGIIELARTLGPAGRAILSMFRG